MTIVGIDLGTTNSLVAYLGGGVPSIVPNGLGDLMTPSAIAVDGDEVVVGRPALEILARDPSLAASLFKREMGLDRRRSVGRHKLLPQELSGTVLRALRLDAEAELHDRIYDAVITVPAYFNDAQRQATKDAGELAGFNVRRILNEPTAAALAHGLHLDPEERNILVFDLGGGTFDVSILECADGVLQVMASAGEAFLGGEDFTRALMEFVLGRREISAAKLEAERPVLYAKLRHRVERAKCQLTDADEVEITLPDPKRKEWVSAGTESVDRAGFASCTKKLMERLAAPTWRALRDASLNPGEVDEVLLVGGATRMPLVREWVETFFGRAPRSDHDPDTVVALGAAIQAGLVADDEAVADIVVTDVMPHTLGIELSKEFGGRLRSGYFMPIIERNTTIPTSRVESVTTTAPGQRQIEIAIYQGEFPHAADNLKLGEFSVKGLPPGPPGREAVEVRFTYDLNGLLEVEATVSSTGARHSIVIEHRPGKLSDRDKQRALKAMESLKIHPRDVAKNRLVLEQARRVYTEVTSVHRQRLTELMHWFEEALESHDPETIDAARHELEVFMSSIMDVDW